MGEKILRDLLVVDDEIDFLDLAEEIFAKSGYRISTARDVSEAMALLKQYAYRIALVDYRLPGTDGNVFAEHLHRVSPDTKIVFLTGDSTVCKEVQRQSYPVEACLVKPVTVDELLELVNSMMSHDQA